MDDLQIFVDVHGCSTSNYFPRLQEGNSMESMDLSLKMHNNKPNVDVEIRRTRLTSTKLLKIWDPNRFWKCGNSSNLQVWGSSTSMCGTKSKKNLRFLHSSSLWSTWVKSKLSHFRSPEAKLVTFRKWRCCSSKPRKMSEHLSQAKTNFSEN